MRPPIVWFGLALISGGAIHLWSKAEKDTAKLSPNAPRKFATVPSPTSPPHPSKSFQAPPQAAPSAPTATAPLAPDYINGDDTQEWKARVAERLTQRPHPRKNQKRDLPAGLKKEWATANKRSLAFATPAKTQWLAVEGYTYFKSSEVSDSSEGWSVGHRTLIRAPATIDDFGKKPLVLYDPVHDRIGYLTGELRVYADADSIRSLLERHQLQLERQVGRQPIYLVRPLVQKAPAQWLEQLQRDSEVHRVEIVIEQDLLQL